MSVEIAIFILFVLYIIGCFLEGRAEKRRAAEALQAMNELLAMSKGRGKKAKEARAALSCWASTPPTF